MIIKRLSLLLAIFALSAATVCAQNITKPKVKGKTSFAIIADQKTAEKCAAELMEYKTVVESEGLPTYLVSADWESPEQVKTLLKKLYRKAHLEGAVFVGDIPIAMITKAQFMTSAYKMDEREFPLATVAVPSDRFYDDFDLTFDALRDSTQGNKFFYELDPESLPYIECDIYTARIVPQSTNGDRYEQISAYLKKVVREHRANNPFDQFVSYTGEGSYSNSLVAWRAEQQILNEQFGDTFKSGHNNAKFLRYSMADYMKDNVIKELRRPDLDLMVFHEHGDYDRMYLSGNPEVREPDEYIRTTLRQRARRVGMEKTAETADKYGFDSSWYSDYDTPEMIELDSLNDLKTGIIREEINAIAPNARFVIFDACYNGDFRNEDFIAGKFVMSDGSCVVTFANSVNVLQDKAAFEMLGLLKYGVRIGLWAQHNNILESHIIGDPTFHFTATAGSEDINAAMAIKDNSYWKGRLNDAIPDVQNVALKKLFEGNEPGISGILFDKFCNSPYAVVRYTALSLLERLADSNFTEALKLATTDRFEFIRRVAITRMGDVGDESFLPYLVDAYVCDRNAARVIFNATSSLVCFDKDKAAAAIEEYFKDKTYYNMAKDKETLLKLVNDNPSAESLATIKDKSKKTAYREMYIQFLRNRPYHQNTDELLKIMLDPTEDEYIRTLLAESFAWYECSVKKGDIVNACRTLLASKDCPEGMEPALKSACTRLTSNK